MFECGYLTSTGQYYMGDRQGNDIEVPLRPSLLAIAEVLAAQETRLAKLEGGVSK